MKLRYWVTDFTKKGQEVGGEMQKNVAESFFICLFLKHLEYEEIIMSKVFQALKAFH